MIFGSLYNLKRLNSAFEEVKTEQKLFQQRAC